MNTAILLAAGSGRRMQAAVSDKILAPICGTTVFGHSIKAFVESGVVDRFTVVFRDELQREELISALLHLDLKDHPLDWVQGGSERQVSVFNALRVQPAECDFVFIHDSARPLVSVTALQVVHAAVRRDGAAVLAHRVTDTIKRIPAADQIERTKLEDLERNRLWAMETPQAFKYSKILKAYQHVHDQGLQITDDAAAAACIDLKITLVPNEFPNPKITTPADLDYAEWLLHKKSRRDP